MLGSSHGPWMALALLAALAATAAALPAAPVPEGGAGVAGTAPDPEAALGWTLRRVESAEDAAGVHPTEAAREESKPALDVVTEAAAPAIAALGSTLVLVESQVVDPVEHTAAALREDVQDTLVPEAPPAGPAPEPAASSAQPMIPPEVAATIIVAGAAAAGTALFFWIAGSSGTVGAGAAGAAGSGAGAKLAGSDLRRLLPFASPLFTRFEKDTVLGHPKREALYALIMQSPGVSLQSLCESTGLSRTAVAHHLRLLELQHLIVSKRHGRTRHYFENGGRYGREQKDGYAVLQNERSKAVADFIRDHPGAIQKDLCAALGLAASIAHWHVRRLQEALLVESQRRGRTVSYFPTAGLRQLAAPALPAAATPV